MKIKTKKQLNLPQLIEWAWNNNVKGEFFSIDQNEELGIYFATNNDFMMKDVDHIRYNDLFTVEVEEEITEDTKFSHIVFIDDCDLSASYENKSINEIKYGHDKEFHAYINGEFKLIWTCKKGLVE